MAAAGGAAAAPAVVAAAAPAACPAVGAGLNYAQRIQSCIGNIAAPRAALLARFGTPAAALNAVLDKLVPPPAPAGAGAVGGAGALAPDVVVGAFLAAFVSVMRAVGNDREVMIARAGDLYHDIGDEIAKPIGPGPMPGKRSMEQYISTLPGGPVANAELARFKANIKNIIPKFDTFGRTSAIAVCPKADLTPLNRIMRGQLGITHIILDACFGNPFSKNLTTGLEYVDSTVGQIDGASKISEASLEGFISRYIVEHHPFRVPHFYYDTNHIVTTNTDTGVNTVEVIVPPAAVGGVAAANAIITCKGGISVNAICHATKLTPPRGTGVVASKVTINRAEGPYVANHIVFIKTLTDWGQLVYCFFLKAMGINTAFITNDEYCLCLAAILGLPCVIRTPSTSSPIVELYSFSRIELTPEERIAITSNLRIGISVDDATELRTIVTNARPIAGNIINTCLIAELDALTTDIDEKIATFQPIPPETVIAEETIRNHRFLSILSPYLYIRGYIFEKLEKLEQYFTSLGHGLTAAYVNLKTSADTESAITNLIAKFSNFLGSISGGGYNNVDNIKLYLRLYSYSNVEGNGIIPGRQRVINALAGTPYAIAMAELPGVNATSNDLVKATLRNLIRTLNNERDEEDRDDDEEEGGAGGAVGAVGEKRRGASLGAMAGRKSIRLAGGYRQYGGGEANTTETLIVNDPSYYVQPLTKVDDKNINLMISRAEAYTKTGQRYKPSLNIDAVKSYITTNLSTITSIAEFANFIKALLELTQEDAYESNYAYETYAVNIDYLIEGHKLGHINDTVLTEQMDWYTYAHPETSNLLQNTIPFEMFVSIHKKLASVSVREEVPVSEPVSVLVQEKVSVPLMKQPSIIGSIIPPTFAVSPLTSVAAAAAGGARKSRRRHRSSPRRPRRITRNKKRDRNSASHKRRTIRSRK